MAPLSPSWEALPFLRADERPEVPAWLTEEREWRFHPRGGPGDRALYLALCAALAGDGLLPGGLREGSALRVPLAYGPMRLVLEGSILAEFLSSELGEAQRHLQASFHLPGAWSLQWRLMAGQDLASGRVRLRSATWVLPGERRSFRHLIAARALRRALCEQMETTYVSVPSLSRPL